jgi:DNA polymerase-1
MTFDNDHPEFDLNDNVLIIDGMNTFIRAFAAIPTMDENGNHIGGVTGFLKSVGFVIRKFKPTRVYIVFDGKGGSKRRRELFPEYKAGRKTTTRLNRSYEMGTAEDQRDFMKYELSLLGRMLLELPVTTVTLDYVEADDIMSYIASNVVKDGGKSIIYSTDKDFLQLVSEDITVWNPIKKRSYNQDTVLEDYQIHPTNFLLYRALTGDSSDNIPGIRGLGIKTLLKFMPQFAEPELIELDELFSVCANSKSKIMKKIYDSKDIISLNLKLMSLEDLMIGERSKLQILSKIDNPSLTFNKVTLTKLLIETNILPSMSNYDSWATSTFQPLTRFNDRL